MILADTSVWVDHLRRGNRELTRLLEQGLVLAHPFVIGEVACGHLKRRDEILSLLAALPDVPVATHEETMRLVAVRKLPGKGLGWIDVHLLASTLLANVRLWTRDKPLERAAKALGIAA